MFLTITADNSDEILLQRELEGHELVDCDVHAIAFASNYLCADVSFDGHVPLGCGEFSVELAEFPKSGSCWSSRSYFTIPE